VILAEPDVVLTDYALTIESVILAWLLHRQIGNQGGLRQWFIVFFCALGLASLAGGTSHGFIQDKTSLLHTLVWNGTLIAIGIAALSAWMIGACLIADAAVTRWLRGAAVTFFVIYCVVIVFVANTFQVAIIHYLPATLFLFATFGVQYLRRRDGHLLSGTLGVLMTFVAAGVQQAGIGLHPAWFDHNAFYHLIQAVALGFLFFAARGHISTREA
jgi:hypothetical protein